MGLMWRGCVLVAAVAVAVLWWAFDEPRGRRTVPAAPATLDVAETPAPPAAPAPPPRDVPLALLRALTVHGRVTDVEARPLAGVAFRLRSVHVSRDGRTVRHVERERSPAMATSDERGEFVLDRVPPDARTDFVAELHGYQPKHFSVEGTPAPLSLVLERLPVLSGLVHGADGRPLRFAAVLVAGALEGIPLTSRVVVSDADGRFEISLEPFARHVFVWGPGHEPVARELVDAQPIQVRLRVAPEIRGVVRDDRGMPVPGAHVAVRGMEMEVGGARGRLLAPSDPSRALGRGDAWLVSAQGARVDPGEAVSDASGAFVLRGGTHGGRTFLAAEAHRHAEATASWREGDPEVEFVLPRYARLRLTVTDPKTGAAVPSFTVSFGSFTNFDSPTELWVPPGRSQLRVRSSDGRATAVCDIEVSPGEEETVHVQLRHK